VDSPGMVQWQVLVNTVMGVQIPQKVGNFLTRSATITLLKKDSNP
jgi:hypothetical protein